MDLFFCIEITLSTKVNYPYWRRGRLTLGLSTASRLLPTIWNSSWRMNQRHAIAILTRAKLEATSCILFIVKFIVQQLLNLRGRFWNFSYNCRESFFLFTILKLWARSSPNHYFKPISLISFSTNIHNFKYIICKV